MYRTLSRNTIILSVSNVGGALLSFVLVALIGRAFGESGLGVYVTALAWVFPVSLVAEFGLGTLITRDVAQNPALSHDYLHAAVIQRLVMGGSLMLIIILAAPLLSSDSVVQVGIAISAPLILVNPLYGTFTALLRAYQHMLPIALMNIGMLLAQVILTAAVIISGGDVIDALAVNTLTSAGQLAVAWWAVSLPPPPTMTINSTTEDLNPEITTRFSDILRRGYPFAVAAVLAAINTRAGFILLESLAGTQAVGVFAAATRITDGLRTLPNALFGALLPALAGLSTTPDAMRHLFWRIMAGLGAFGVICGTFLTVLGGTILALVFGGSFAYDGLVLAISGWALLAALLRGGMTLYLYALGHETRVNQVALLILFPYIALNLWLIPGQGAIGAALALLIAEASGFILLVVWRR